MSICPHGDPFCPCPDGLACHYEGDSTSSDPAVRPMPCPSMPGVGSHCHVEGCGWVAFHPDGTVTAAICGLVRIRGTVDEERSTTNPAVIDACGGRRAMVYGLDVPDPRSA